MQQTVLILGARGRFGLAAAQAFADAGWNVLAQIRPDAAIPTRGLSEERVRWIAVDLNDIDALAVQAKGAHVVVNALNPAYTNSAWQAQGLRLMEAAIAWRARCTPRSCFPATSTTLATACPAC
jgi:nucleoside-diphosphate-sugar epimerase